VLQLEVLALSPTPESHDTLDASISEHQCKQRLECLLGLVRSDRFSIQDWRHREVFRWRYNSDTPPFRLDADTQRLVQAVDGKLSDYFWDRWMLNLFREADDTVRKRARHSRDEWQRVLSRKREIVASTHYIHTAMLYYAKALAEPSAETDQTMIEATIALEALITDEEEKSEVQYKLARRVAYLVGDEPLSQKRTFALLKKFYDLRSKIVHGSTKAEVLGKDLKPEIPKLLEYARICLLYFLALRDLPKKDILGTLDNGTFDLTELQGLKSKAWKLWGEENWTALARRIGGTQ
jgi:hypothetical protein